MNRAPPAGCQTKALRRLSDSGKARVSLWPDLATNTRPMRSEPTAYTARIVATGLATAAGAILTSLIDSKSTLVGAVVVAMAVSAIGQAMRGPLDRLERRIKAMGVVRALVVISLVGFLIGAAAAGVHDSFGVGQLRARIARKLQPPPSEEPVRATPTASVPD